MARRGAQRERAGIRRRRPGECRDEALREAPLRTGGAPARRRARPPRCRASGAGATRARHDLPAQRRSARGARAHRRRGRAGLSRQAAQYQHRRPQPLRAAVPRRGAARARKRARGGAALRAGPRRPDDREPLPRDRQHRPRERHVDSARRTTGARPLVRRARRGRRGGDRAGARRCPGPSPGGGREIVAARGRRRGRRTRALAACATLSHRDLSRGRRARQGARRGARRRLGNGFLCREVQSRRGNGQKHRLLRSRAAHGPGAALSRARAARARAGRRRRAHEAERGVLPCRGIERSGRQR